MLILDILDDWIPASVIVDLVAITWGIDNVQSQSHSVFLDNVGDSLDFGSGANWLIRSHTTLRVDEVRCEDGVDQGRFAQTRLTNADNVELETSLQQLLLDLGGDAVETDVAPGEDRILRHD